MKPYVDRIGQVVFLTESQFHSRREHTDIREIRPHELKALALDNVRIGVSINNPTARNLIRERIEERLVTFIMGEDCQAGDHLSISLADGKVYRAIETYDLVARQDYKEGQSVVVNLESKSNMSPGRTLRDALSVAFRTCLDFCKSGYEGAGDLLDKRECDAWTKVVEGLISEVRE